MAAPTTPTSPYSLSDLFKYAGSSFSVPPDAETQYFIDKGYLTPGGTSEAGQTTYNYMGGNIPKSSTGDAWGSFWQPQGISGTAQLINPKAVANDPGFGNITSIYNMKHPEDTDFMSKWFPMIASTLLTAGMGGAIGAVGGAGGLFGGSNLLSSIPKAGQLFGNIMDILNPQQNSSGGGAAALPYLIQLMQQKGG
jgi:hypothetical protein